MSKNFSAEQYEKSYVPAHLSQWEVPKRFQEYPRRREGCTVAISDEDGRFLDGVNKPTFKELSPFIGTWGKDYPRPGGISSVRVNPGVWMIKSGRARWVEAFAVEQECYCKCR
ncbi:protein Flattop homolog [Parasteatoda tepidariorum]|uniref:protein Flattop homolog n=1 Tax=Parasteatoda tepidariorum TaxID=114398 RepID=UPI0039BCDE31